MSVEWFSYQNVIKESSKKSICIYVHVGLVEINDCVPFGFMYMFPIQKKLEEVEDKIRLRNYFLNGFYLHTWE